MDLAVGPGFYPIELSVPLLPERYAAAVAAGSLPQTNSVPSTQIRCNTMASLRASATFALRIPRRLATSSAHRLSVLNLVARDSGARIGWVGATIPYPFEIR